jgi:hypothetical protein
VTLADNITQPPSDSSSDSDSDSNSVAPAAAAPATSANLGGNKKGIVWPNGDGDIDITKFSGWSWHWAWEHAASRRAKGHDFVPQFWGPGKLNMFQDQQANDWQGQTVSHVMFFNEPDLTGNDVGPDIAPADAVDSWLNDYAPLRDKGIKLGSASPCGANPDLINQFETQCKNRGGGDKCMADFIPIHVYAGTFQAFKDTVEAAYVRNGNRSIWVTEYACHDFSGSQQCEDPAAFVTETGQWMGSQPWIARYSLFAPLTYLHGVDNKNNLMQSDPPYNPTPLWDTYIAA